jgi:RNA polymerase sigma-70 factor (ECF subfamily)
VDLGETRHLIRRALAGEDRAFSTLLERLRPRLVLWVTGRLSRALKARVEPEDVVQQVFLDASKGLAEFRGADDKAFLGWLFRIAENRIRDLADQVGAQKRQEGPVPSRVDPTPSQAVVRKEMFERVRKALDELTDDYRQVIVLVRLEERPVREVAELMARSENAIRVLYCRAMRDLRALLETAEGSR